MNSITILVQATFYKCYFLLVRIFTNKNDSLRILSWSHWSLFLHFDLHFIFIYLGFIMQFLLFQYITLFLNFLLFLQFLTQKTEH